MPGALLAAASGAALLAAAPPLALTPLALLALAPLLVALRRRRTCGTAAALGWLSGAVFYAGLMPWMPATITRTQAVGWPAAGLLFALFVAAHALQFAVVAAAVACARTAPARCAVAAAAWMLVEYAFPQVLPWSLGAILGPHPLLRQAAELVGTRGLALLVVLVNALVAEAAATWRRDRGRAGTALACAALLIGLGAGFGTWRTRDPGAPRTLYAPSTGLQPGVRVAVVQGGWSTDARDPLRSAAAAWADYAALTELLAGRADVVLWPENVLPVYLRDAPAWRRRGETLARRLGAALLVGALDRAAAGGELSAVYVFTPSLSAVRYKSTLVPYGETAPAFGTWLPRRWWRAPAPRLPGPVATPVDAGPRLAPSVCFEAITPGAFNAMVGAGAEVLVNLSDDGWFDSPWAAAQHLEMTRLRAVETRRWLVRASHSGTSAVVDPHGRVVATLPYRRRGVIRYPVERRAGSTPYVRCGDAPLLAAAAGALLAVAGGGGLRTAQARSKSSTSAAASACS